MANLVNRLELWALRLIALGMVVLPLVLFIAAHIIARRWPTVPVYVPIVRHAQAAYIPPTGAQPVIPFGSSSATFPIGGTVFVTNTIGANIVNTVPVSLSGATVAVSGTVAVSPIPLPVVPSGTFSVGIQNTPGVLVQNTVPVTAPTLGVSVINSPGVNVQGTIGVAIQNTPGVLVQGTIGVALQNTPAIAVSSIPTVGVIAQATIPVATLGVQLFNTPAVQGNAGSGTAAAGNPVQVGGVTSAGNIQAVRVDNTGSSRYLAVHDDGNAGTPFVVLSNIPTINVAIQNTPGVAVQSLPTTDPCLSVAVAKSNVFISTTAATTTTTPIVLGVSGKQIFVCGWSLDQPATAGTPTPGFAFSQSSPTASAGCPTPISALYYSFRSGNHPQAASGTHFIVPSGNLCLSIVGAGVDVAGGLTYVQQ